MITLVDDVTRTCPPSVGLVPEQPMIVLFEPIEKVREVFYDTDGRLERTVNPLGEVQENRYNGLNQLESTERYGPGTPDRTGADQVAMVRDHVVR